MKRSQLIRKLDKGSKEFWGEINNLLSKQNHSALCIKNGNIISYDKRETPDMFMEFFVGKTISIIMSQKVGNRYL